MSVKKQSKLEYIQHLQDKVKLYVDNISGEQHNNIVNYNGPSRIKHLYQISVIMYKHLIHNGVPDIAHFHEDTYNIIYNWAYLLNDYYFALFGSVMKDKNIPCTLNGIITRLESIQHGLQQHIPLTCL